MTARERWAACDCYGTLVDWAGLPGVWVNRLGDETGAYHPTREIPDLVPLPAALGELVAS